jgi:AP-4 complex subunit epsilon-1
MLLNSIYFYKKISQVTVLECLKDNDESIKRVTLDLLYTMTNPKNCKIICKKLTDFAKKSLIDSHLRKELIGKIGFLAEKYAPGKKKYLKLRHKMVC